MSSRQLALWPLLLTIALLLGGCSRNDPQVALEAATQRLQENIEAKNTSAVMDQLHGEFLARQSLDREWARRTMTLLFLRHRNVRVIALSKSSWVDPVVSSRGHSEAQIALTGAEGLIPDSARHYAVRLEWWLEDGEWKLGRLDWE
ncbi:hypothetical protein [Pseudomonas sp. NCCP-436]|uniref:hypothetical protein n=1 Tax=Pseudomonas sp. NCCP-436 TaxID=2842481 RepID=UPI001C7F15F4|nr:hypothetical protein [Pseudomonas sp. NCCP-436]GIZ10984.1 hypothetical protein NCCP436_04000 [Pseudomonas sp. NCCP-436]